MSPLSLKGIITSANTKRRKENFENEENFLEKMEIFEKNRQK